MPKELRLSDLLAKGAVEWPKKAKDWKKVLGGAQVVYENDHVVAFHDPEDIEHESPREPGETRVTILPKRLVPTLMDLGVTDEALNAQMLGAVQQVAYRLGLQDHGFEVRSHVLPPYQHRPGFALHIRSGKPPKKGDEAAT